MRPLPRVRAMARVIHRAPAAAPGGLSWPPRIRSPAPAMKASPSALSSRMPAWRRLPNAERRPHHAAEADMAGRSIDRLAMPRRRAIPAAAIRRAEVRAALQHLSRNPDVRQARVVACLLVAATRISRNAAGLRRLGRMPRRPPVRGPLPDVPDHVVEGVAVRRKGHDRRGTLEPILADVLDREVSPPDVGHVPAARHRRITPGKLLAVEPAARSELSLRFGGQVLARPAPIEGDVHDRVVVESLDIAAGL
jgi:hypothetical protein